MTYAVEIRSGRIVNTDPQSRCYDGCHFSSRTDWEEWRHWNDVPTLEAKAAQPEQPATQKAPAQLKHQSNLNITKGERYGNWQDFDVNEHSGLIRVVLRMEDDKVDLPLGQRVEQFLLNAAQPATERNFCERCGQRLGAADYIHTCTPPSQPAEKDAP